MTVSKTAADAVKTPRTARREPAGGGSESAALEMGELSELLGYSLKRAQLKVFEDFLRCVAPLQLTPAQFSVLLLTDKGRAVLARAKKLVAAKHEARLNELLGPANRVALLTMLEKIAGEF